MKKELSLLIPNKKEVFLYLRYCLFFGFFILKSCDKNRIYNEFDSDVEDNRWISNKAKVFSFSMATDEVVNLKLHLGHIYDFQFDSIPLQIVITYPDGHTEVIPLDVRIKNESGQDIADCSGDICDLYYTFKNKVSLKKGEYSISITNTFSGAFLPNILGIGIQVEK